MIGFSRPATRPAWGGLLVAALLLCSSADGAAETIQMSVATRVIPGPSSVRVEIDVMNGGDEPARQVVPSVEFQARVVTGEAFEALAPAVPRTISIDVPLDGASRPMGRWPVLVRVAYVDSLGRPFEAIHVDTAVFDVSAPSSDLRIILPDVSTESTADIAVRLDRGSVTEPVRLAFGTASGVTVTPQAVVHQPDSASSVRATISNIAMPEGSQLPLIAIAEYDTQAGHQTVTAVSTITIGPSDSRSRLVVIAVLLAVTIVAWGVIAALAVVRRRRQEP